VIPATILVLAFLTALTLFLLEYFEITDWFIDDLFDF